MPTTARERRWLFGAAVVALALPLALARHVDARLHAVTARWGRTLGEPVVIGSAEVDLSGALRLDDVRVGHAFAAEAIEAGVALPSLLAGRIRADEVRVRRPVLKARLGADGTLDLAALAGRVRDARRARKAAAAAASSPLAEASPPAIRRILVEGGELTLELEGRGRIRARGVELHPQEAGVRVVAGGVTIALAEGPWQLGAEFARSGLDVTLPELQVERAALAGGEIRFGAAGAAPLVLARAVVTRDATSTRLEARVDDASGRPLSAELRREGPARLLTLATERLPLAPFAPALPAALDFEHAVAGGHARVRLAAHEIAVDGELTLTGLLARHAVLAAAPVPIDGHVRGEATWEPQSREGHASFDAESAALAVHGELEAALGEGARLRSGHLFLQLPEVACADALAAVPVPLRERLDGLVLDGRIAGTIDLGFDASGATPAVFDVALDNRCRVVEDAPGAAVERLAAAGPGAAGAKGAAFVHTLPSGATRTLAPSDPDFVAISRLPAHVVLAFVAGEDARFFVHHGFDAEQLRRSFEVDMQSGRVERGGSTISQQLVKNLFLTRERTLSRKLLEAVLTWRLEARVPKRRILEAYLNVIELGDGVYGLEAGARRWFGKPAAQLDVAEAAFLAAMTPAPQSSTRRILAEGRLDAETRGRVDAVLRSMWRNRFIDAARLNAAMKEPLALKVK